MSNPVYIYIYIYICVYINDFIYIYNLLYTKFMNLYIDYISNIIQMEMYKNSLIHSQIESFAIHLLWIYIYISSSQ